MKSYAKFFLLFPLIFIIYLLSNIENTSKNLTHCNELNYEKTQILNSKNFSKFDANLEILEWRKWQTTNIKKRVASL